MSCQPISGRAAGRVLRPAAIARSELADARARQIRLAAFPSACCTIVPPAIAALRDSHPEIALTLVEAEPSDAARVLTVGEIDLAVAYTHGTGGEPSAVAFSRTKLFDEPFLIVLPGHRLLDHRRLTLNQLSDESWIVPPASESSGSYRTMLMNTCADAGFEPRVAFEIEDTRAGQALIAQGLGVALLPRLALESTSRELHVRPLTSGAPVRRIAAWTLPGPTRPPVAQIRWLLEDAARGYQ